MIGLAPSGSSSTQVDPRPITHPAPTLTGKFNQEWTARGRRAEKHEGRDPDATRLTVSEAALLQSYPPEFRFVGNKGSMGLQIGNAVPPLLAEAILRELWS